MKVSAHKVAKPQTKQITLAWGPGVEVAPEDLVTETEIREIYQGANDMARAHLMVIQDYKWSADLDPAPDRVLRRKDFGPTEIVGVKTDTPKARPEVQRPLAMVYRVEDGSATMVVTWKDGLLDTYKFHTVDNQGRTHDVLLNDNHNGTLTYTIIDGAG